MEPTLAECRPPWVVVTRADDPWVDAAVAELQDQGGMVVRLPGRELHSPSAITPGAFAGGAASGADVDAALVDGRLIATLAGADWPGSAPVMA